MRCFISSFIDIFLVVVLIQFIAVVRLAAAYLSAKMPLLLQCKSINSDTERQLSSPDCSGNPFLPNPERVAKKIVAKSGTRRKRKTAALCFKKIKPL
jgi:hypothetical protein